MQGNKLTALAILVLIALGAIVALTTSVYAESNQKPLVVVIALGLMGEDPQLKAMMSNITEVNWKVITGDFTYDDIKDAKMIIFVQVDTTYKVSDAMAQAIAKWFAQGGKTLWVTGDSDYSGGDYMRIPNTNKILEAVGSHLRNDNCEVEDPTLNAGKPYRPTALIQPSPELAVLAGGVYHPVLFHGPGPLAIVYNGKWYPFFNDTKPPLPNIYKIAVTSKDATIHEFVKPYPKAYNILNPPRNSFVLMAAEIFYDKGNIVILSGEAPFDHYTGMYRDSYHGYKLSGTTFVKNVILWGVGLLGQRIPTVGKELINLQSEVQSLQSQLKNLQSKVAQYEDQVKSLQSQLNQVKSEKDKYQKEAEQYKNQLQSLQSKVTQYENQVKSLQNQVSKLNTEVSSLSTRQYVLLIVGIIIGLIIGAVIGFKAKK